MAAKVIRDRVVSSLAIAFLALLAVGIGADFGFFEQGIQPGNEISSSAWLLFILRNIDHIVGIGGSHAVAVVLNALALGGVLSSLNRVDTISPAVYIIVILLFLFNPLIVRCAAAPETALLPALSTILWRVSIAIEDTEYTRRTIMIGLCVPVFIYALPDTRLFLIPFLGGAILLVPVPLVRKFHASPIVLLITPALLLAFGIWYWNTIVSGGLLSPSDAGAYAADFSSLTSSWLQRHQGEFATAVAESAIWMPLMAWGACVSIIRAKGHHRRRAVLILILPLLACGLAADYGISSSPLVFFTVLVVSQLNWLENLHEQNSLASAALSWVGGSLAIWYYSV